MEYVIYYLSTIIILLFLRKRSATFFFILIWLVFVGFRSGNGVDWYTTMAMFERIYDISDQPLTLFVGYNLFDSELVYKSFGIFFHSINLDIKYSMLGVALLQSVFMFYLLKDSGDFRLTLYTLMCVFTMHFGFNAVRQGLCLISFTAFVVTKDVYARRASLFVSFISHWASLPVIFLISICRRQVFDIKFICWLLLGFVVVSLAIFFNFEIIEARFSGAAGQYLFNGFGLKIYYLASTVAALFFIEKPAFYTRYLAALFFLTAVVFFDFNLIRYFLYYIYFSALFISTLKLRNASSRFLLILLSTSIAIFEWHEISRFVVCHDCGVWFPYQSLIFNIHQ